MEMIALIVSGLALLAAGVCLCLLMREKKRNLKRNADVCNYADGCLAEAKEYAEKLVSDALMEISNRFTDEEQEMHKAVDEKIAEAIGTVSGRIERLEKGAVPDYQKAMAAANAVNDFNKGISAILGYDPAEALAAQRQKERGTE